MPKTERFLIYSLLLIIAFGYLQTFMAPNHSPAKAEAVAIAIPNAAKDPELARLEKINAQLRNDIDAYNKRRQAIAVLESRMSEMGNGSRDVH